MRSQTNDPTTPTLGMRPCCPAAWLWSLVQKRLRRSVNSRATSELARNDPADAHCRLERTSCHFPSQRREQMLTGEGHPSAHYHHLGIEDVQQVGDADTKELGCVVHHVHGELVAIVRSLIDGLSGDPCEVTVYVLAQPAFGACIDLLACSQRDVGPRGIRFEATIVPAFTAATFAVDGGMADFPGAIGRTMVESAVHDDSATDAGPDSDPDCVTASAGRSPPPLPENSAVRVVVQCCGQIEPVVDDLTERHVDPPEIRRQQNDAALRVERTRCSDPHANDLSTRDLAPGAFDGAFGQSDQAIDYIPLTRFCSSCL